MQADHCKSFTLSEQQRNELQDIVRKRSSTQAFVLRAKIILAAEQGLSIRASALQLSCNRGTVTLWRKHWVERSDDMSTMERLQEAPRPGAPPKFKAEQVCQIMALACEKPENHGYILSHWSQNALAKAAMDKNIVESISQRQVGRFLKSGRYSPR